MLIFAILFIRRSTKSLNEYCSKTGIKIDPLVINLRKPKTSESRASPKESKAKSKPLSKSRTSEPQDHKEGQNTTNNGVVKGSSLSVRQDLKDKDSRPTESRAPAVIHLSSSSVVQDQAVNGVVIVTKDVSRPPSIENQIVKYAPKDTIVEDIPTFIHQGLTGSHVVKENFRLPGIPSASRIVSPVDQNQLPLNNQVINNHFQSSGIPLTTPGVISISGVARKRPYPTVEVPEIRDFKCNLCSFATFVKEERTRHLNEVHGRFPIPTESTSPNQDHQHAKEAPNKAIINETQSSVDKDQESIGMQIIKNPFRLSVIPGW